MIAEWSVFDLSFMTMARDTDMLKHAGMFMLSITQLRVGSVWTCCFVRLFLNNKLTFTEASLPLDIMTTW